MGDILEDGMMMRQACNRCGPWLDKVRRVRGRRSKMLESACGGEGGLESRWMER